MHICACMADSCSKEFGAARSSATRGFNFLVRMRLTSQSARNQPTLGKQSIDGSRLRLAMQDYALGFEHSGTPA